MADEQKATKAAPSRRYYIVAEKGDGAMCLVGANAPSQALYRSAAHYCTVRVATVAEVVKLMQKGVDLIDPIDEPELPLETSPASPPADGNPGSHTGLSTQFNGGEVGASVPLADGPLIGDAADHSPQEQEIL